MDHDGHYTLRFAANLGMLFPEHAFLQRFAAAAELGFKAVEFPRLYENASVRAVKTALRSADLSLAQFSFPRGDVLKGERGLANDPRRRQEFRDSVAWTLDAATQFDCKLLTCPIGNAVNDISLSRQWGTVSENLYYATECAACMDIIVLIEPLNPFDHPGILLTTMAEAHALIAEIGHENLRIMCDIYHLQRSEGNLTKTILQHLPLIEHVQVADSPGRNQPGTGEINYSFIFHSLVKAGFSGWVALEYQPLGTTSESLTWLHEYTSVVTSASPGQHSDPDHVSRI